MVIIAEDANNVPKLLMVDANGYLKVVNSAELPAGTQIIGSVKISDGTEVMNIDTSNRGEVSVLNLKPDGTNAMPAMDAVGRPGFIKVTDGTNTLPTMDVASRKGFVQITNGTYNADVNTDGGLKTRIKGDGSRLADVLPPNSDGASENNNCLLTFAKLFGFNGTTWDRLRCDANKSLEVVSTDTDTDDDDIASGSTRQTVICLNYVWDAVNSKWVRMTQP